MKAENKFEDYNTVLEDWLKEGVIEQVPAEEVKNGGYFLLTEGSSSAHQRVR